MEKMYFDDQSVRRVISVWRRNCGPSSSEIFKTESVLFNSIIHKEDSIRTVEFLDLIEKYDYPNDSANPKNIAFHVILMHSPQSLFDQVRTVLSNSNIPDAEFDEIKWHLNGRLGVPKFINGKMYYTDDQIFNYYK
jgi:hypothetical protein